MDKKIAETEANHFDADEAHTATEEYVEDLKPNCDWVRARGRAGVQQIWRDTVALGRASACLLIRHCAL